MPDRDYAAIALQYAESVISGLIPACKWTVAACLRQLDDLAREKTEAFPYRYNAEQGGRVCAFLEMMPHIKGRWKSPLIVLEPWQIFTEMTLFSWVHDGGELDGLRRFRTAYEEVPRKNAKSTKSAGRALYMLGPDNEQGAECYSAATTRDQARIMFDVARAMAKKTPAYGRQFGISILAHALVCEDTESFLKALSADDNTLDGLNPHFAGADELHAHKTRGVWDVLDTATGAREQALLSAITTAGSNRAGICYEVRTYVTKILNDVLSRHPEICESRGYKLEGSSAPDDTFFGIIYTIDDGDDWTSPEVWAKANPNLGVSVKLEDIERACRKAQQLPSAQPNFLTKRLDVWINADSAWMDMRAWDSAANPELTIEQFAAEECFIAIDLASVADIAAKIRLFRRLEHDKAHYYAFGSFYIPEDAVEASDNSQYAGWEETGKLIATDGNVIDQNAIQDDLREDQPKFQIREVAYDPFQATKFATELLAEGFPMVEVTATVANFSAPMKELEALVRAGRFHHDGDPVMTWMISNVVAHLDRMDNIFPTKQTANNKIDGPVALIMAMNRAMFAPAAEISVYETRGVEVIGADPKDRPKPPSRPPST